MNEEFDKKIEEWENDPDRPRCSCPCGWSGGPRNITAHRAGCDVWQYHITPQTEPAVDPLAEEDEDPDKMPIMELLEKRRARFRELYGLHPMRLYVGVREKMKIEVHQETAGIKKEHENIHPVLGMDVYYVPSESTHLYMAG